MHPTRVSLHPARRLTAQHNVTGYVCLPQGPNAEARKAVDSKNPYVSAVRGHVRLDDDPDVKEVRCSCGQVADPSQHIMDHHGYDALVVSVMPADMQLCSREPPSLLPLSGGGCTPAAHG